MVNLERISFVSIVGAGPGDPELLTLKAVNRLQKADVVLIDALVHPGVLTHCRPAVQVIEVGKRGDKSSSTPQEKIHQLMLKYVRQGRYVVRLKGGNPSVFARGLEEALFLKAHDIHFEVIPGISSALIGASAAGLFPSVRHVAYGMTILTGHSAKIDHVALEQEWVRHAQTNSTLIFLMPMKNLGRITHILMKHGRRADTPAAVIRNATRNDETILVSTLNRIEFEARRHQIKSPALLMIGDVIAESAELRTTIDTFSKKTTEQPREQYV